MRGQGVQPLAVRSVVTSGRFPADREPTSAPMSEAVPPSLRAFEAAVGSELLEPAGDLGRPVQAHGADFAGGCSSRYQLGVVMASDGSEHLAEGLNVESRIDLVGQAEQDVFREAIEEREQVSEVSGLGPVE